MSWSPGKSLPHSAREHLRDLYPYDPDLIKGFLRLSTRTAWAECQRGDRMLWLAMRLSADILPGVDRRLIVLAACDCARLSLGHLPEGNQRRIAVDAAERWARGEALLDAVLHAAAWPWYDCGAISENQDLAELAALNAARAAFEPSRWDAATCVRLAALRSAHATEDPDRALAQCADLVRKRITWEIIEKALQGEDNGKPAQ